MRAHSIPLLALAIALSLLSAAAPAQNPARRRARTEVKDSENIKHFQMQSKRLSTFWGRPTNMDAGVVLPPKYKPAEALPVCYSIHGFGGSHRSA